MSNLFFEYPKALPVSEFRDEISRKLSVSQVVVVVGDTGSGKTTQLPKMIAQHFISLGVEWSGIAITQPRRVAAYAVAQRLAEETQTELGQEVGYAMRFEKRVTPKTCIKVATDGVILAELGQDPLLNRYSALMIDEVHERSLNIDFLLGQVCRILKQRPDFKVVLSSATLHLAPLHALFPSLEVVNVPGRLYPIEYRYETQERLAELGVQELCKASILQLMDEEPGDVLVFLPTERDIIELESELEKTLSASCKILPLYGRMASGKQRAIFEPASQRKIVLATNIAETSLTVPGIRYVVDTGLARISSYHPGSRTVRLPIVPVALSSLTQRAGRCGRVGPGVCLRLFPESELTDRREYERPEIARTNLAGVVLQMFSYDLGAVEEFPFPEAPAPHLVAGACRMLHQLGALQHGKISPLGRRLARLPCDPALGRMLIEAASMKCLEAVAVIVAGLTIADPRVYPKDEGDKPRQMHARFAERSSEFLSFLKLWNYLHSEEMQRMSQSQFRRICHAECLSYQRIREWRQLYLDFLRHMLHKDFLCRPLEYERSKDAIHKCILTGTIGKIGLLQKNGLYKFSGNRLARVNITQGGKKKAKPQWIMAHELVEMNATVARTVAVIDPNWIASVVPQACTVSYGSPHWVESTKRVQVNEYLTLYGVRLKQTRRDASRLFPEEARRIFIEDYLMQSCDFDFARANNLWVASLEELRAKTRCYLAQEPQDSLRDHYQEHLPRICSTPELEDFVERNGDERLRYSGELEEVKAGDFPEIVRLEGANYSVAYRYAPGQLDDGVRLRVPLLQLSRFPAGALPIPGMRSQQIKALIRSLPKSIRKGLQPIDAVVEELLTEIDPASWSLDQARKTLERLAGLEIPEGLWLISSLPPHLQVKIEVVDVTGATIGVGTDPQELAQFQGGQSDLEREFLERYHDKHAFIDLWDELPEKIQVGSYELGELFKFPALIWNVDRALVGLKSSVHEAEASNAEVMQRFARVDLERLVSKYCKQLRSHIAQVSKSALVPESLIAEQRFEDELFSLTPEPPFSSEGYSRYCDLLLQRAPDVSTRVLRVFGSILPLRRGASGWSLSADQAREYEALFGAEQLRLFSLVQLERFPLYLRSWEIRLERSRVNPNFERRVAQELKPFYDKAAVAAELIGLEEYKLGIFAPQLRGGVKVGLRLLGQIFDRPISKP